MAVEQDQTLQACQGLRFLKGVYSIPQLLIRILRASKAFFRDGDIMLSRTICLATMGCACRDLDLQA